MKDLEAARRGIPSGVVELTGVPGIDPKTARLLTWVERPRAARGQALERGPRGS